MKIYKAKKHSEAVRFMTNYYVSMCGFKVRAPNPYIEGGVFAVASKVDQKILTLLDDKTIKITSSYGQDLGLLSESDFKQVQDEYHDIASCAGQDE